VPDASALNPSGWQTECSRLHLPERRFNYGKIE
jgi:hypothetical protein